METLGRLRPFRARSSQAAAGTAERPSRARGETAEGLAYARAWRVRNKAKFDALYPNPPHTCRCETCGQLVLASESVQ